MQKMIETKKQEKDDLKYESKNKIKNVIIFSGQHVFSWQNNLSL